MFLVPQSPAVQCVAQFISNTVISATLAQNASSNILTVCTRGVDSHFPPTPLRHPKNPNISFSSFPHPHVPVPQPRTPPGTERAARHLRRRPSRCSRALHNRRRSRAAVPGRLGAGRSAPERGAERGPVPQRGHVGQRVRSAATSRLRTAVAAAPAPSRALPAAAPTERYIIDGRPAAPSASAGPGRAPPPRGTICPRPPVV